MLKDGRPVRLLLRGGLSTLALARNALGRERARSMLDTGEASTRGGVNRIHLEQLESLAFYFWEAGLIPGYGEEDTYVRFHAMPLPSGLHGSTFSNAHDLAIRRAYATAEWYSNAAARFGQDISLAIKSSADTSIFPGAVNPERNLTTVYRAKNKAKTQHPVPLFTTHAAILPPFLYRASFSVVDGYNSPGNHVFTYDYQGHLIGSGPLNWTPPANLWRTTLTQGRDGRFYVMFSVLDGSGHLATLQVQARQVDDPDTILWSQNLAIDPDWPANRIPAYEIPLNAYDHGDFVFFGWKKHFLTGVSFADATFAYDWFVLDRASGALLTTWLDTAMAQFSIDGTRAWARRSDSVSFTKTPPESENITAATFAWGVEQYTYGLAGGLPQLVKQKDLTAPGATVTYQGPALSTFIDDTSNRLIPAY